MARQSLFQWQWDMTASLTLHALNKGLKSCRQSTLGVAVAVQAMDFFTCRQVIY